MSKSLNNPVKNDNISGILKYKLYLTSPRLDWPNFLSTLIIERGQVLTNQRPRIQPSANQRPVAAPYCSISSYYDQLTITDQIKSLQSRYSDTTLPLTAPTHEGLKKVSVTPESFNLRFFLKCLLKTENELTLQQFVNSWCFSIGSSFFIYHFRHN